MLRLRRNLKGLCILLVFLIVALLVPLSPPASAAVDTFVATEDAYVNFSQGTTGNYDMLKPYMNSKIVYLKFNVSGLNDTVNSVKLQLRANSQNSGNAADLEVYLGSTNSWSETTIDDTNAPTAGTLLGSYDSSISANTTIQIDLDESVIDEDGTYTLILKTTQSGEYPVFLSKDASYASSSEKPSLIIDSSVGDLIAPAAVSDLVASNATSSSIDLDWTAPGDNGSSGTADSYDIRYSTSSIDDDTDFANAAQVSGEPAPSIAGTGEGMTVSGLTANTTYYFAMKSTDDSSNVSALSNVPSLATDSVGGGGTPTEFVATEDAYVNFSQGTTGNYDMLKPYMNSKIVYLKFNVSGVNDTVNSVKLQLRANSQNSGNAADLEVYLGSTNSWSETTIDDTNAPTAGTLLGTYDSAISANTTIQIDLDETVIDENGTYTLVLKTTQSGEYPVFLSKDASYASSSEKPSLIVETSGSGSGGTDTIAPAAVFDLFASNATSSSIDLTWTSPGDDGLSGTANTYDIRYSKSLINASNFSSATQVSGFPTPAAAGTTQQMTVSGLSDNTTYYFAMKTTDDASNTSDISRVAIITTDLGAGGVTCDHTIDQNDTGNIYGDSTGMNAQPGDIICIDSGRTNPLPLFNFNGTAENPITFINYGGQVQLEGGSYWAIVVRGSSHFRITGTGDSSYQYGIKIDPEYGTGIEVASLSTNFEIDHVWISEVDNDGLNGAGMSLRSNPSCDGTANRGNFTQYNTIVHHNLIEGTENEGLYIGSSNYQTAIMTDCDNNPETGTIQPDGSNDGKEYAKWGAPLIGVRVFDNIVNDGGRDGIQIGSAVQDVEVYNNQVTNYATRNNYPHIQGIEINPGTTGKFYNNIVNSGVGHGISIQGRGDIQIFNNVIIDAGADGIYSHDRHNTLPSTDPGYDPIFDNSPIHIWNNTIINPNDSGIDFNNLLNDNNTIRNNVIVQSSSDYYDISDPNEMTLNNNYTTTSISAPDFVNAAADNYKLQSTSPLIDAGYNLTSEGVLFDYAYEARPLGSGYDIGAFEYVAP